MRNAAATVRRPGVSKAPTTSTLTRSQTGRLNTGAKGSNIGIIS